MNSSCDNSELRDRILDVIRSAEEPLTKTDVMRELTECGPKTVFKELGDMIDEGVIETYQVEQYSILRLRIKARDFCTLEHKFAIYLLLLICREPGRTKTYYVEYEPNYIRTKHERINDLEDAGLIWVDKDPRKGHTRLVYPTDEGKVIGDAILSVYPKIKQPEMEPETYVPMSRLRE